MGVLERAQGHWPFTICCSIPARLARACYRAVVGLLMFFPKANSKKKSMAQPDEASPERIQKTETTESAAKVEEAPQQQEAGGGNTNRLLSSCKASRTRHRASLARRTSTPALRTRPDRNRPDSRRS